MDFDAWEPLYLEILDDFGFSRSGDEEAALALSCLLKSPERGISRAREGVRGREAVICGNAPSLIVEIDEQLKAASSDKAFIAADGAAAVLLRKGILPDVIVTDLDGDVTAILEANERGSVVVVHAHGDNIDKVIYWTPLFTDPVGTTQARPFDNVLNFGGFTDGDRCVFLAKHLGASRIRLIGFDYDDPRVTPRKAKKLAWAKRLIEIALSSPDEA